MTITAEPKPNPASDTGALDYARALLNILDDSASEQERLRDTQSAVLNILDDFAEEKSRLEGTQKALLNIMDDFAEEKNHLEDMKSAVLNILEDLGVEKSRLEHTEQALRSSLREKETLLKEIHHRVKNNLQVIASLLRLQSRYLQDDHSRMMFEESQNRVHSISLVHEMLYQAADLARVDFASYLNTLTTHLLEGWRGASGSISININAPGILLAVDTAIPCGLIVNELVTNSLKHAFPGAKDGLIRIGVEREAAGILRLLVQDNGIGLPRDLNFRRSGSLGLELVNTLVRQLRGTLDVKRAPATFEIFFKLQV